MVWCDLKMGTFWGGGVLPSITTWGRGTFLGAGSPVCRGEAVASERDAVKVSGGGGRRRSARGRSPGAAGFAMEASSAVVLFSAPCQVMVRSGLGCARCRSPRALPGLSFPRPSASQQPELSAGMVLPFSWSRSSPEGGKLHTSGFFHCCHHLLSPDITHRCLARSAGAVVALRDHTRTAESKGPGSVPPPHGEGPATSQLCDLPAWSLSQLGKERKRSERFSLLCEDKCILFLSRCSFI